MSPRLFSAVRQNETKAQYQASPPTECADIRIWVAAAMNTKQTSTQLKERKWLRKTVDIIECK